MRVGRRRQREGAADVQAQPALAPYEPVEAWRAGRGDEPWKDSIAESERLSRALAGLS